MENSGAPKTLFISLLSNFRINQFEMISVQKSEKNNI